MGKSSVMVTLKSVINKIKPDVMGADRLSLPRVKPTMVQWRSDKTNMQSGNTREGLKLLEDRKRRMYTHLLTVIQQQHAYVEFFPLVTTYNGAIAKDTWRAFMTRLGLDDDARHKVLSTAAHALCVGFSTMGDIHFFLF